MDIIHGANIEKLKEEKNVDELIRVLNHGGTRALKSSAAKALGQLKDEKAVEPLMDALKQHYLDPGVRSHAAQALYVFGGDEIRELFRVISNDIHENNDIKDICRNYYKLLSAK
ncbi:MAG: HEAT repeat domain-containing protein [Bacteroidetes bacterium]|nr:HEAT repeat domain-containing protein [Bacteroidota bacterium]